MNAFIAVAQLVAQLMGFSFLVISGVLGENPGVCTFRIGLAFCLLAVMFSIMPRT